MLHYVVSCQSICHQEEEFLGGSLQGKDGVIQQVLEPCTGMVVGAVAMKRRATTVYARVGTRDSVTVRVYGKAS